VTDKGTEGLVLAPGTCSPIDWSKVLRLPSPDGQAHACTAISRAPPGVAARCIVLPGEAQPSPYSADRAPRQERPGDHHFGA
jgi:hypothetical protein